MTRRLMFLALLASCALAATAAAQGIPHEELTLDCTRCHANLDDRTVIEFDHDELDFALEGHHEVVGCARCHDIKNFARADDQCMTCHTDYHQGRLYPECQTCHSPEGWTVIDSYGAHSRTAFQLMGAHIRLDCDSCHEREILAERAQLAWDCFGCHELDYETVTSPSHTDYGFDRRCETCHTQFAWRPTTMREHPGDFPIFSGTHAGEWSSCSDCHTDPGDYGEFSCLECHKHNESEMAEEHDDVPYYYYDSYGCYGCHPAGIAEEEDD